MTEAAELTVPPHAGKTPMNMLEVSRHAGGVAYANMADTIATAELMSRSGIAVRSHLRGEPGACHAVVMLAIAWDMNPYLVANKSYSVNNQLAFEAQLIQSVIQVRAPIKGRIKTEYKGKVESASSGSGPRLVRRRAKRARPSTTPRRNSRRFSRRTRRSGRTIRTSSSTTTASAPGAAGTSPRSCSASMRQTRFRPSTSSPVNTARSSPTA